MRQFQGEKKDLVLNDLGLFYQYDTDEITVEIMCFFLFLRAIVH